MDIVVALACVWTFLAIVTAATYTTVVSRRPTPPLRWDHPHHFADPAPHVRVIPAVYDQDDTP